MVSIILCISLFLTDRSYKSCSIYLLDLEIIENWLTSFEIEYYSSLDTLVLAHYVIEVRLYKHIIYYPLQEYTKSWDPTQNPIETLKF